MTRRAYRWLVCRALFELMFYDVIYPAVGFQRTLRRLGTEPAPAAVAAELERTICDAVLLATCLYWKRVRCLQRSFCAVRLLRAHGVAARLVIGYRVAPFFSHAWVEVGERIVNDSPAYRQRLRILYTA